MAEPETIISGHYQAIRAETLERIRLRDQFVVWLAAVFSGALGAYTSEERWWGLLVGVPFMTMITGLLYAHTDLTLNALGRWFRDIYGPALDAYRQVNGISYPLEFWDHSPNYKHYASSWTFYIRYWATSTILLAIGLVSTILAAPHIELFAPQWHLVVISLLVVISFVGVAGPVAAWWVRYNEQ